VENGFSIRYLFSLFKIIETDGRGQAFIELFVPIEVNGEWYT
jgi:hypothetical protein